MADEFQIDVEADKLKDLIDKALDSGKTRPLMQNIGARLTADAQINFRSQSDPTGKPWKPTIRGGQILRDTGRLRNSITYTYDDESVSVGTNVIYAAIHNYGGKIKAKNAPYLAFMVGDKFVQKKEVTIPQRQFLGIEERQVDKINKAVDRWVDTYFSD